MLKHSNEIVIIEDEKRNFRYLYKLIIGDGHCFLNCYLHSCCPSYNSIDKSLKGPLARKLRLDFANFLMSDSDMTAEKVSMRLGFLNPNVISTFLKTSKGESSLNTISELSQIYDGTNEEEVFELLSYADLINTDGHKVDKKYLKELYSKDHRILVAKADGIPEEQLGIGIYPINLKIYEMLKFIPMSYQDIEEIIEILIHPSKYLTHFESILFAEYVGINAVCFNLGHSDGGYKQVYDLTERKEGCPDIFLINMSNVHWNMVEYRDSNSHSSIMMGVDSKTKNIIFEKLNELNDNNMLPLL